MQNHRASPYSSSSGSTAAADRYIDKKTQRPTKRINGQRVRALKLSQTAKSALLDAAGLNLAAADLVHWDSSKFSCYLSSINKDDARQLVRDLIASDQKGGRLDAPGIPRITIAPSGQIEIAEGSSWTTRSILNPISYNSKYVVLAGLLGELSSRDFVGTLDFMESLQIKHKNRLTEQYIYDAILQSGFRQDPSKAWETYTTIFTISVGGKYTFTMG